MLSNPLVILQNTSDRFVLIKLKDHESHKKIKPIYMHYSVYKNDNKKQWLLRAYDDENKTMRDFDMKSIVSWEAENEI